MSVIEDALDQIQISANETWEPDTESRSTALRHGDHDQSDHGPDEEEERGEEGEDDAVARREV